MEHSIPNVGELTRQELYDLLKMIADELLLRDMQDAGVSEG